MAAEIPMEEREQVPERFVWTSGTVVHLPSVKRVQFLQMQSSDYTFFHSYAVAKLATARGHNMQIFNDLHHSNI